MTRRHRARRVPPLLHIPQSPQIRRRRTSGFITATYSRVAASEPLLLAARASAMSDLRAFFASPRGDGRAARPPPPLRRSASPLDARIELALRRSREEARVAALSDEEALREALAASLAEVQPDPEDFDGAPGGGKVAGGTARPPPDDAPGAGADSKRRRTGDDAQRSGAADVVLKRELDAKPASTSALPAQQTALAEASSKHEFSAKPAKPVAPLFARSTSPVPAPDLTCAAASLTQAPLEVIDRFNGSLDLLYCKGWLVPSARQALFAWMTSELRWHRVVYTRPGTGITIRTPRYTTTYGRDETGAPDVAYQRPPVALPPCLDDLRRLGACNALLSRLRLTRMPISGGSMWCTVQHDDLQSLCRRQRQHVSPSTGETQHRADQVNSSYHSDDEAFLGPNCTIASISLGAARDFFMRESGFQCCLHSPLTLSARPQGTCRSGHCASAARPKVRHQGLRPCRGAADGTLEARRWRLAHHARPHAERVGARRAKACQCRPAHQHYVSARHLRRRRQ